VSRTYDDLHWTPNNPRGDYAEFCDYCRGKYRRSTLVRTRDGLLACDDCMDAGVDVTGLIEENERSRPIPRPPRVWK
jgi:hypothetical protein